MRSRESVWPVLLLVLTGLAFAGLAAWSLVARSTIPAELDGTVTTVELRHEKHPGVDDVWMVAVDGGTLRHIDRDVAALLTEGARVEKAAWDATLVVDGRPHPLSLSADARAMLGWAPVLALVVGALAWISGRRTGAAPSGTSAELDG